MAQEDEDAEARSSSSEEEPSPHEEAPENIAASEDSEASVLVLSLRRRFARRFPRTIASYDIAVAGPDCIELLPHALALVAIPPVGEEPFISTRGAAVGGARIEEAWKGWRRPRLEYPPPPRTPVARAARGVVALVLCTTWNYPR
jgi:hypothetical protein